MNHSESPRPRTDGSLHERTTREAQRVYGPAAIVLADPCGYDSTAWTAGVYVVGTLRAQASASRSSDEAARNAAVGALHDLLARRSS